MRRLGALPLVHQPDERWMYDIVFSVGAESIWTAVYQAIDD